MPRKGDFRFAAEKVGLTYSCPRVKNADGEEDPEGEELPNPVDAVWNSKEMLAFFLAKHNIEKYIFGRERHKTRPNFFHYHIFIKFQERFESADCRFWDLQGVHPNIRSKPRVFFENYCAKDGDYITNYWEPCPWAHARDLATFGDAVSYLWKKRPRDMMLHGKQIEDNIAHQKKQKFTGKIYYGPYLDIQWDHENKALVLQGDPGMMKTQWAKYWALHHYGSYFYCKNSLDCLKHYNGETVIIFDDIHLQERQTHIDACFDVEAGGSIPARNKDIVIPPGPKIWLRNPKDPEIPDPKGNIFPLDRRAVVVRIYKLADWF